LPERSRPQVWVVLDVTWRSVEERLQKIGEGEAPNTSKDRADQILADLGLIDRNGLTPEGEKLFMAMYVAEDREAAGEALAEVLKRQPIVNALLESLWPLGTVNVTGAVNLLKRLTRSQNEQAARRWLNVLNRAGLVVYNRSNPKMRVLFNPAELVPPEEAEERERERGHGTSSPVTPRMRTYLHFASCFEPRANRFAGGSNTCRQRCSKCFTASSTARR
jgi:hypothetical protein